ncbi:MAG TPA: NAD-dependent epimerase [Deltaproteobacteria bacterium]|nr:MAG: NAD-dependent epimerase [Deltaproteobacteria bacterium GWA2_55_82]OGQ63027.1 MAG: NAD-dependent epimerase [Deltaproteobacteria bacterium RIFCSPLOWO2_02_FULL_55_12]OIJ72992.1 MAG: NAD-dependent epimerase [Deltaproteobacteria bacterium GWC2_55_46]HBG45998.1 NAD-dependent epimerase [Deltaproteobacteria bacterium]HCY11784.1 NAD-dependent epimerase [Deltaproteobacteria bacterium]
MRKLLVTGSSGLIGGEVVERFSILGWKVAGIDNNMRARFFGKHGDTRWNQRRLQEKHKDFVHLEVDIRDRERVFAEVKALKPDAIVHAAAQPSHDLAASMPFEDFDTNAGGTINLLEAARRYCPEAPFVHLSTNKVYGDAPNELALKESETRYDYADDTYARGITEDMRIDRSKHSLFGASKVAADVMAQEYGRYFGMPTACLRGGCLTGPNHSGVELHGFLSYLIRCNLDRKTYKVYGYKGKQVRDNIHSYDVTGFIQRFIDSPRRAEVYNLGGGRGNSISIIEAFTLIESISGIPMSWEYVEANRSGDHICYISDISKASSHYPGWEITKDLAAIFTEIYESWARRGRRA